MFDGDDLHMFLQLYLAVEELETRKCFFFLFMLFDFEHITYTFCRHSTIARDYN